MPFMPVGAMTSGVLISRPNSSRALVARRGIHERVRHEAVGLEGGAVAAQADLVFRAAFHVLE